MEINRCLSLSFSGKVACINMTLFQIKTYNFFSALNLDHSWAKIELMHGNFTEQNYNIANINFDQKITIL